MATTPAPLDPAQAAPAPPSQDRRPLPAWAQILVVIALFVAVKTTPNFPYAGQFGMFLGVIAATLMMRQSAETWRDLGLRWATSWGDLVKGAGIVALVFVLSAVMSALVQFVLLPALGLPVERTFPDVSTLTLYLIMIALVWTTNAFGEEMVFRGFLMSRFAAIFGGSRVAWVVAALAQAVIFGLGHAYQGLAGVIITGVVGLVFGLSYLLARRNLWPVIIAHALINTWGLTALHLQATGALPAS